LPPPGPQEVLNNQSFWRFHAAWRRVATEENGKYDLGGGYPIPDPGTRWILSSFTEPTPPPPAGWMRPDYDDSNWPRHVGPPFSGYGYGQAAEVCILAGRVRFGVADAGRADEMFLVGVDGENAALEAIMDETNYGATGLNNSDQIGRAAFNRLMSILGGGVPEKDSYLPSPLITKDNVMRFYNPEGTF
jgi:hypothetical protein